MIKKTFVKDQKISRRFLKHSIALGLLAVLFFITVLPRNIYAQFPGDINKHPTIILDKRAIEEDRRVLKLAQKTKDPNQIKGAKERLRKDIVRLKRDRADLRKRAKKIAEN